jgi:hypothetical protein
LGLQPRRDQRIERGTGVHAGIAGKTLDGCNSCSLVLTELDGQKPFEPFLACFERRIRLRFDGAAQHAQVRGVRTALECDKCIEAALRIGIGELKLHQRGGDQSPHTAVRFQVVHVSLVHCLNLFAAVEINQHEAAILQFPNIEEPAISLALPDELLPPVFEKHIKTWRIAGNEIFKHRTDCCAGRTLNHRAMGFKSSVQARLLCIRRAKAQDEHNGKQGKEGAEH